MAVALSLIGGVPCGSARRRVSGRGDVGCGLATGPARAHTQQALPHHRASRARMPGLAVRTAEPPLGGNVTEEAPPSNSRLGASPPARSPSRRKHGQQPERGGRENASHVGRRPEKKTTSSGLTRKNRSDGSRLRTSERCVLAVSWPQQRSSLTRRSASRCRLLARRIEQGE